MFDFYSVKPMNLHETFGRVVVGRSIKTRRMVFLIWTLISQFLLDFLNYIWLEKESKLLDQSKKKMVTIFWTELISI